MPTTQTIGSLTVTRVAMSSGAWYVWRDENGKQVHAGLDSRQLVGGRYYRLRFGRWSEE